MKPKQCCLDYMYTNGFSFCPICGFKLQFTHIIYENEYTDELWNHVYDYVINNQKEEDYSRIKWILKQSGEDGLDVDIEEFCEYCFEGAEG